MRSPIDAILSPPEFDDPAEKRAAASLHQFALAVGIVSLIIAIGLNSFARTNGLSFALQDSIVIPILASSLIVIISLATILILQRGYYRTAALFFMIPFWTLITITAYFQAGVRSPTLYFFPIIVIVARLLLGHRAALSFIIATILLVLFFLIAGNAGMLPQTSGELPLVRISFSIIASLILLYIAQRITLQINHQTLYRLQRSESELSASNRRLNELLATLEKRVEQRTADLERRARQMQAAAEVGHAAATIKDLDALLSEAARLISQRFAFEQVGLYLLDAASQTLVLRQTAAAVNSTAGAVNATAGKTSIPTRLPIERTNLPGAAATLRQPQLYLPAREVNRAQYAIPLLVADLDNPERQLLGVMDVHSQNQNDFDQQTIAALQVLADQLAVAIHNTQLLAATREALESTRRAYTESSRQAWRQHLNRQHLGYHRTPAGTIPITNDSISTRPPAELEPPTAEFEPPAEFETPAELEPPGSTALHIPIRVRGHIIGYINAQKPADAGPWIEAEKKLLYTLIEQLGVALESARLYEETQRRAERERLAGEITAKLRTSNDPEQILQTAVRELRQALHAHRAQITIQPTSPSAIPPEPAPTAEAVSEHQ